MFISKQERALVPQKELDLARNQPAPGDYEKLDGFDIKWREKDETSSAFREPVPRKIVPVNLYNPHAEPVVDKNKMPEPCTYKVARLFDVPEQDEDVEFEPRLNTIPGGKVYIEDNLDRFGLPIRPMKPISIVPGPDHYDVGRHYFAEDAKGGLFSNNFRDREPEANSAANNPGPSYYNPTEQPKKLSFLFNPSEQWIQ